MRARLCVSACVQKASRQIKPCPFFSELVFVALEVWRQHGHACGRLALRTSTGPKTCARANACPPCTCMSPAQKDGRELRTRALTLGRQLRWPKSMRTHETSPAQPGAHLVRGCLLHRRRLSPCGQARDFPRMCRSCDGETARPSRARCADDPEASPCLSALLVSSPTPLVLCF